MILYLIAPNGRFVGELRGTAQEILAQVPEGHDTTHLIPPRNTDYWNGTSWVDIGAAPAWFFKFNYDSKTWEDTRDLEETKRQKWESIKLQRNSAEQSGFEYNGNRYDSDLTSQMRIMGAVLLNQPARWTLQDNEVIELTTEELREMGMALSVHINALHERARAARQLIMSCVNVDQVDAVNF